MLYVFCSPFEVFFVLPFPSAPVPMAAPMTAVKVLHLPGDVTHSSLFLAAGLVGGVQKVHLFQRRATGTPGEREGLVTFHTAGHALVLLSERRVQDRMSRELDRQLDFCPQSGAAEGLVTPELAVTGPHAHDLASMRRYLAPFLAREGAAFAVGPGGALLRLRDLPACDRAIDEIRSSCDGHAIQYSDGQRTWELLGINRADLLTPAPAAVPAGGGDGAPDQRPRCGSTTGAGPVRRPSQPEQRPQSQPAPDRATSSSAGPGHLPGHMVLAPDDPLVVALQAAVDRASTSGGSRSSSG
jgi:hypothetical protein